jgi:hypothetical protein
MKVFKEKKYQERNDKVGTDGQRFFYRTQVISVPNGSVVIVFSIYTPHINHRIINDCTKKNEKVKGKNV